MRTRANDSGAPARGAAARISLLGAAVLCAIATWAILGHHPVAAGGVALGAGTLLVGGAALARRSEGAFPAVLDSVVDRSFDGGSRGFTKRSRGFSLKRIRSGSTSKPTPMSTRRRSGPSCRGFENAQRRRIPAAWCTPSSCVGSAPRSRAQLADGVERHDHNDGPRNAPGERRDSTSNRCSSHPRLTMKSATSMLMRTLCATSRGMDGMAIP